MTNLELLHRADIEVDVTVLEQGLGFFGGDDIDHARKVAQDREKDRSLIRRALYRDGMSERSEDGLTHLDEHGNAKIVDVSAKQVTTREAVATARIRMKPETLEVLTRGTAKKGDVLAVARVAGIMAAKKTPELIPLCHHIALTSVTVDFEVASDGVVIKTFARARDRTGVEMEALTAASIAALTIYDMLKAIDREMTIDGVRVLEKRGGKTDFSQA